MMMRRTALRLMLDYSSRFSSVLTTVRKLSSKPPNQKVLDSIAEYTPDRIRNFSIIAHVDHGKSTLADRLLEFTGMVEGGAVEQAQLLDRLPVERERGITVKAQTATLFHEVEGTRYLLNLIDTPGHVDFSFEVQRSLAACESVILLVDANEGVQAQTVANFYLAFEEDLTIIPVLNKIDLPRADPKAVKEQLQTLFDIDPADVLEISAKYGRGISELLTKIVVETRPPCALESMDLPTRCLLVDSWFEPYRGAIALVAAKEGTLRPGDEVTSYQSGRAYTVKELGVFSPDRREVDALSAGQVGYVVAGMRSAAEAQVGDTLLGCGASAEPLRAFKPAVPMVFAGLFPSDQSKYEDLKTALGKLTLNDSSVSINADLSPALGAGWRLGFLGLLHMDVFRQRLEQEYDADLILTIPNVPHRVTIKGAKNISLYGGEVITVYSASQLPPETAITSYEEPMVMASLIFPEAFLSPVLQLCLARRGRVREQTYVSAARLLLRCEFPLAEIVVDFYDRLKAETSGYASLDYEERGFAPAPLVKLQVLLNDAPVDELALLVHASRARARARELAERLAAEIPRQQFLIIVKVCHGKRTLGKAEVKPYRKDVTAKIKSGSDATRRTKLLQQQAAGKRRMRLVGRVEVPRQAFINVLRQN